MAAKQTPTIELWKVPCRENNPSELHITLSDKLKGEVKVSGVGAEDTKYRVCYSSYANLSEIKTLVKELKPDKISSVLPQDVEEKKAIIDLIDSCVETKEATSDDEEYDAIIPQVAPGNSRDSADENNSSSQESAKPTSNALASLMSFCDDQTKSSKRGQNKEQESTSVAAGIPKSESKEATSDDEEYGDSCELISGVRKKRKLAESQGRDDDTPEIEEIIAAAVRDNQPEYVMKSLREEQRRRQMMWLKDWFVCDIFKIFRPENYLHISASPWEEL